MMRKIRKQLSLILTIMMLVTMLPLSAISADTSSDWLLGDTGAAPITTLPEEDEITDGTVWADKSVADNEDGSFDIMLSAFGRRVAMDRDVYTEKYKPINVVFVLDTSGSMTNPDLDAMIEATKQAGNMILNANASNRVAVVYFDRTARQANKDWTWVGPSNAANTLDKLTRPSTQNYTNTSAGLNLAKNLLDNASNKATAQPVIVLMSDGAPNCFYTNSSWEGYTGRTENTNLSNAANGDETSVARTIERAAIIAADGVDIYTVGYNVSGKVLPFIVLNPSNDTTGYIAVTRVPVYNSWPNNTTLRFYGSGIANNGRSGSHNVNITVSTSSTDQQKAEKLAYYQYNKKFYAPLQPQDLIDSFKEVVNDITTDLASPVLAGTNLVITDVIGEGFSMDVTQTIAGATAVQTGSIYKWTIVNKASTAFGTDVEYDSDTNTVTWKIPASQLYLFDPEGWIGDEDYDYRGFEADKINMITFKVYANDAPADGENYDGSEYFTNESAEFEYVDNDENTQGDKLDNRGWVNYRKPQYGAEINVTKVIDGDKFNGRRPSFVFSLYDSNGVIIATERTTRNSLDVTFSTEDVKDWIKDGIGADLTVREIAGRELANGGSWEYDDTVFTVNVDKSGTVKYPDGKEALTFTNTFTKLALPEIGLFKTAVLGEDDMTFPSEFYGEDFSFNFGLYDGDKEVASLSVTKEELGKMHNFEWADDIKPADMRDVTLTLKEDAITGWTSSDIGSEGVAYVELNEKLGVKYLLNPGSNNQQAIVNEYNQETKPATIILHKYFDLGENADSFIYYGYDGSEPVSDEGLVTKEINEPGDNEDNDGIDEDNDGIEDEGDEIGVKEEGNEPASEGGGAESYAPEYYEYSFTFTVYDREGNYITQETLTLTAAEIIALSENEGCEIVSLEIPENVLTPGDGFKRFIIKETCDYPGWPAEQTVSVLVNPYGKVRYANREGYARMDNGFGGITPPSISFDKIVVDARNPEGGAADYNGTFDFVLIDENGNFSANITLNVENGTDIGEIVLPEYIGKDATLTLKEVIPADKVDGMEYDAREFTITIVDGVAEYEDITFENILTDQVTPEVDVYKTANHEGAFEIEWSYEGFTSQYLNNENATAISGSGSDTVEANAEALTIKLPVNFTGELKIWEVNDEQDNWVYDDSEKTLNFVDGIQTDEDATDSVSFNNNYYEPGINLSKDSNVSEDETVEAGAEVTYTLIVTNSGAEELDNIIVTDKFTGAEDYADYAEMIAATMRVEKDGVELTEGSDYTLAIDEENQTFTLTFASGITLAIGEEENLVITYTITPSEGDLAEPLKNDASADGRGVETKKTVTGGDAVTITGTPKSEEPPTNPTTPPTGGGSRGIVPTGGGSSATEINDSPAPLAMSPEPVWLFDEDVPLANIEDMEIPEEIVPLAGMPQTGADNSLAPWLIGMFASMIVGCAAIRGIRKQHGAQAR